MVRTTLTSLGIVLALASVAIGCGNEPPPKNPDSWLDSLEQKDPGKKPNLDVVGDDDDDDDDAAPKKPAEPAPPAVTAKPSSGRPLIQKGPTTSIAETFGTTPGAVLKLSAEGGEIVLKIPEFALDTGYNIEWKVDKNGKVKKGLAVGTIAYLKVAPGDKLKAKAVTSKGDAFELRLPLGGKESVNLAVGSMATDDQGVETGKVEWKIYAPTRVDTVFKQAFFNVPTIGPVMVVHATLDAATETAAE